jgi:hypothetical protein
VSGGVSPAVNGVTNGIRYSQRRLDGVTRLFAVEQPTVTHFEGHSHGGHEAFDVAMFDEYFVLFRTHGKDLPFKFVLPSC